MPEPKMQKSQKLLEQWQKFERMSRMEVYPSHVRKSFKRAFYAGAAVILNFNISIADIPEQEGVEVLKGLWEEAQGFIEELKGTN